MLVICEAGNIPALFNPSFLHLASPLPFLPPSFPLPSSSPSLSVTPTPPHPTPPPMCKPACPPVGSSSWSVHSVSAAAETGSRCSWSKTPVHGRHLTQETMPQCLVGLQGGGREKGGKKVAIVCSLGLAVFPLTGISHTLFLRCIPLRHF